MLLDLGVGGLGFKAQYARKLFLVFSNSKTGVIQRPWLAIIASREPAIISYYLRGTPVKPYILANSGARLPTACLNLSET